MDEQGAVQCKTAEASVAIAEVARTSVAEKTLINEKWKNRNFVDFNGRKAKFEGCDFRYAIFKRAYFRNATFSNCRFEGARFVDCNLRGARFIQSSVGYVVFTRCLLDPKDVISSLPPYPNVRRESLRNLKANAMEIGDYSNIRLIVLKELEATKLHLKYVVTGFDSHYQKKYGLLRQRFGAGLQYFGLKVDQLIWGHGERPWQLLVSAGLVLAALTLLNFWSVLPRVEWGKTDNGLEIFRYVIHMFLGMEVDKTFQGFSSVDYALVIMRYVYIGLFVSVLYKSVSHR